MSVEGGSIMSKPDLTKIIALLESNEEFSITETQYQKSTGTNMPKSTYYLKKNSALSRLAKKYGFSIEVNERSISLRKTI